MSSTVQPDSPGDVAIIGMAGRFPGSRNIAEFWDNLVKGVDSISHFSAEELGPSRLEPPGVRSLPNYVRARGVLEDAESFDAAFFGVTPREAAVMDPQQRLFLEVAWESLEHAGYAPGAVAGAVGVWAGSSHPTYYLEHVLPRPDIIDQVGAFQAMLANDKDFLATRVSYKLDLHGPSVSVQTACSTSLVAVCHAYQALVSYQCDMALAGGVSVSVPQRRGYLYQQGAIGSPDGRCRPFDAAAAGTVSSDGLGVVVLKRLSEAIEDGDTIYAVIKGAALNNDGSRKAGYAAPSVDGQAEVIRMAQALAGLDPRTLSYVETHGTATPLGDPVEIAALTQAFRASTADTGFCAIGSVKSNIGHLDAAAGVAGVIKTALALYHRTLPPSLHFTRPNPQIDFEASPFFVNAGLQPWASDALPRRAGVSSFGIGGTNAHAVLEEAPVAHAVKPSRPEQLLVLSARTARALDAAVADLARHLREGHDVELADVAHTLQEGRRPFPFRFAAVASDTREAAEALEARDAARVITGRALRSDATVAFLFPGQGAQHVSMTAELYRREPVFRRELDACIDAFTPCLGLDLRTVMFADPARHEAAEEQLAETSITQPALFAVEYALARFWESWGVSPAAMIGHSLGEYVAACLAGVWPLASAAALVAARGRLMQQQPRGAMMAVRMSAADVEAQLEPEIVIAGMNAPGLTVVSGPVAAIRNMEARLAEGGIPGKVLATSHAFHSPMMDGALGPFRDELNRVAFAPPRLPWVSCLTGDWITPAQAVDPDYWVQQLRQPVRFSDGVRLLSENPDVVLLEVGPGRTLSGLVRQHRNRPAAQPMITSMGTDGTRDLQDLLEAAGRLWAGGVRIDWAAIRGHERRRRVPLPTYPFERQRHWIEPPPLEAGTALRPVQPVAQDQPGVTGGDEAAGAVEGAEAPVGVAGRLVALLSDLSGIAPADIPVSQSFLELGFDSLLLTQVSAALGQTFKVDVPFRRLLEDLVTPGALAAHIAASLDTDTAAAPASTEAPAIADTTGGMADRQPPMPGARLGRDAQGREAWFVPDPDRPGKYLQVTTS